MHVNAGQVLWRPQDISDSFYIVINGRLRAIEERNNDGGVRIAAEYGQVNPLILQFVVVINTRLREIPLVSWTL